MDGVLNSKESPKIKVKFKGPFTEPQEFEAIIDTGFTGAVSMPLVRALPLGLILYSTATFILADGSKEFFYLCLGEAFLGSIQKMIVISLSKGNDVLLGMEFLSVFKVNLKLDYENNRFTLNPASPQLPLIKGQ